MSEYRGAAVESWRERGPHATETGAGWQQRSDTPVPEAEAEVGVAGEAGPARSAESGDA